MGFNVGDLITGNEYNHYGYTNSAVVCEVVGTRVDTYGHKDIRVRVVMKKYDESPVRDSELYWVDSNKFNLYKRNEDLDVSSPEEIDCLFT